MKTLPAIALLLFSYLTGCTQTIENKSQKPVGGSCEGCEAVWEFGMKKLSWVDTLPDFHEQGPKLELSGVIYQSDGKTPATDIILYIYHTDQNGEYPTRGNETAWAKRHGYLRGWIKTATDGRYKFYTLKPGAYPGGGNPAHIHPVIKEPGVSEYWIDEYLFEGDPYLTGEIRKDLQNRGGSGILKTKTGKNGMLIAERDIILGKNVPGYENGRE